MNFNFGNKKIDKLIRELDQSPHAHSILPISLSDEEKASINSIKEKYHYTGDLLYCINELYESKVIFEPDLVRQRGRPSIKKRLYKEISNRGEELKRFIDCLSTTMRSEIADLERRIGKSSPLYPVENNLERLADTCRVLWHLTKKDNGAKVKVEQNKRIISYFLDKYETNVGESATCGSSAGEYTGKFYNFMIELKPILNKLGLFFIDQRTIGRNIRKLLTERNKSKITVQAGIASY